MTDDQLDTDPDLAGGAPFRCATCGQPLGADPEDDPDGEAGLPICGECNRSRNFDVLMLEMDR